MRHSNNLDYLVGAALVLIALVGVGSSSDWPVTGWAGVIGLFLGFYNAVIAAYFRDIDRRRKVDDEYWIQKVLQPLALEPTLKFYGAAANQLGGLDQSSVNGYHEFVSGLGPVEAHLSLLQVLSGDVAERAREQLRDLEDAAASTVGALSGDDAPSLPPDALAKLALQKRLELLELIRAYQRGL